MRKIIVCSLVIVLCLGLLAPVYAQKSKDQTLQDLTKKINALSKDIASLQAQCSTIESNQQTMLAELAKIRIRARRG